ncbi:MAG: hypothetical protein HKN07_01030, partial [Acidimicrobiia bacterium]|nr:hypothetical protein [Acidimicrobiia bacterium]
DDFQFTYETLISPDVSAHRSLADDVYDEIVATEVGDKTFSVTLARATIEHETLFEVLIPAHEVAGTDFLEDWNDTAWVAGGPFEVSEWVKGQELTLTRNANYWKSDPDTGLQLPYLDTVTFRFIPETESLLTAFRNRDVDVIQPPPAVETIESLRAREAEGVAVTVRPGPVWEHLNFQFGPGRLERNPDSMVEHLAFRRAVAHLLDRDAIAFEAVSGYVEPLQSYVEAFTPTYSTRPWEQYGHDPDRSRELIDELCRELGRDCATNPLTAVFSTTRNADMRPRLANFMADMFAEVGIVYEQQLEDSQLFFGETLDNGRWDLGEWAWVGSPGLSGLVAIHDVFDPQAPPPDGSNFYRWGTPDSSVIDEHTVRFADLRDAMDATVDEEEIIALVQEAEQILADQVVIIPLFSRLTIGAVWADKIGGYVFNPSQAGHTWNIERWYRVDS